MGHPISSLPDGSVAALLEPLPTHLEAGPGMNDRSILGGAEVEEKEFPASGINLTLTPLFPPYTMDKARTGVSTLEELSHIPTSRCTNFNPFRV